MATQANMEAAMTRKSYDQQMADLIKQIRASKTKYGIDSLQSLAHMLIENAFAANILLGDELMTEKELLATECSNQEKAISPKKEPISAKNDCAIDHTAALEAVVEVEKSLASEKVEGPDSENPTPTSSNYKHGG
ncbi:hypothetical protein ACQKO6_17780 [Pseudomonas monteilii]